MHTPTTVLLLLAASSISFTSAASASVRGGRSLQDGCTFDVDVDRCFFSRVRNEAESDSCTRETLTAMKADINAACRQARRDANAGEPLDDLIEDMDMQDLDNYFNGGTYLNENTGDVDVEAPFIQEIYDDVAQEATIAYPKSLNNFAGCDYKAVVCLWVRDRQVDNDGNCRDPIERRCRDADPADNTDVCYVDASRNPRAAHVPEGVVTFPGESEGDTHAHGFAWGRGTDSTNFRGNLLFYISMYDHLNVRGYAENIGLAPMCGCIEQMPTMSRADCTQVDVVEETWSVAYDGTTVSAVRSNIEIEFNACNGGEADNDLYSEIQSLHEDDEEFMEGVRQYVLGAEQEGQCPDE